MKANELMIRDWVLIKGTPRKIQAVDGVDDEIMADDELYTFAEDRYHSEDRVDGIPITAEILKKNGIKLEGVGDNGVSTPPKWRNRFEKWVLRTQWRDTFIWYDRTAKYWHLHDMGAAKLIYVHQLQHALRLCRIEHEIKL